MNAILPNQPDAEYRAAEGFNASRLKTFLRSPAHMRAEETAPKESTPALAKGILFHHLLLTPNEPLRVAVRPAGMDGRTKEGKAWLEAHAGQPVVTAADYDDCNRMVESVRRHPTAARAFSTGQPEVSVFADYKDIYSEGSPLLQLKGRMDWISYGLAIVDAKTVEDARPMNFANQASDYGWFVQAAFYRDFLWNPACEALGRPQDRKEEFALVAVEKTPPYAVKCYAIAQGAFAYCKGIIEEALTSYGRCQRTGFYPAYPEAVAIMSIPEWAARKTLNNSMKIESTL